MRKEIRTRVAATILGVLVVGTATATGDGRADQPAGEDRGPRPARAIQERPDEVGALSGHWVLNRLLSDDPSERIPRPAVPPGVRSRDPEGPPSGTAQLRRAIERFSIRRSDSTFVFVYPDRELVVLPDGETHRDVVNESLSLEYRAWIEGPSLLIERRRDDGMTLTETFRVVQSTGRLQVLTRLEGERLGVPVSFVRVYDPAPAETDQPGESASAGSMRVTRRAGT